ncbi:glycosyltransferase [Luteolibacter pohnpeiensis]|uniref:Glycosyltransferase n=1 Tax=Luteolibacter pohnpeiensis TaxID=454153 RepID=A0A934S9J0_9BACT|nr:glycosyltransferase [Luteolibacter pohnpeiensis]MBK1883739.1 glycosyltransferase [Luteolibacter pohnpeiensis]
MKIDIVTDTFAPDVNGVAMTLGRLTEGLRARGHRVHVIRTGVGIEPRQTLAASFPLPGYQEVRVGLPGAFKLRKRWLKKRPDAVYVATESPLGRSAVKTAKALSIPVATGFHTNFQDYMEQYRLGLLQPAAMAYLKRFHRDADCTLAPSPELVEKLRDEGLNEVHLLGRGVDTELFNPAKRCEQLRQQWGARVGVPVVMVVGRVAAEKNLDLAMKCFERMRQTIPDLCCVVVGDGPLRARLEEKNPGVIFAGMRTGEELAKHYASADLLLFPSETETFGNVLLEGMASGLVTLSYDYAASARYVNSGNGLKVPKGDSEAFLRAAQEMFRHLRDQDMGQAARETAERLGWDQVISEFENRLNTISESKQPSPLSKRKREKREKLSCRTLFLSDIHLGTPNSKAAEVVHFLKHIKCSKLVLNGDIIDGWALRRGGRWRGKHSRVIRKILKMMEKDHTEVIYLRGNHDDILERFLPLAFGRLKVGKEHIHITPDGKRYLVVHGDGFDSVSTNHRWLAMMGAVGYDFLLKVNRFYNQWRAWQGKEYFSLSKSVKARVKSAVSFVDRYEELLQDLARHKQCEGIICGHIHTPEDKMTGGIHYLNSGDWVESLTAIIEHHDGRMELVRYEDFFQTEPEILSEEAVLV